MKDLITIIITVILSQSRHFADLHDSLTFMLGTKEQMNVAYFDIDAGCSFSHGPSVNLRLEKCKSRR
jgi:hypothetical protein